MQNTKTLLHGAVAVLFVAAFAVAGVRGIAIRQKAVPRIDGTGADCCTDAVLKLHFGVPRGTRLITSHADALPHGKALVILYPANDQDAYLASQVVGSALWPRAVLASPVEPGALPRGLFSIPGVGGLIFCDLSPPKNLPGLETVMPGLTLLRLEPKP